MKTISFKNFRCVEESAAQWRIYYKREGEQRFIGYYKGHLSDGDDDHNEDRLLGNSIKDYTNVLYSFKWSTTRIVYKINCYEAYRMDEQGIYFSFIEPNDTIDYKHEILGEKEFRFPSWRDGSITKEDNDSFSFVSCEGIRKYNWNEE